jgi:hypothetical protein
MVRGQHSRIYATFREGDRTDDTDRDIEVCGFTVPFLYPGKPVRFEEMKTCLSTTLFTRPLHVKKEKVQALPKQFDLGVNNR